MRIHLELLIDIPTPWTLEKGYVAKRNFLTIPYSETMLEFTEDKMYFCWNILIKEVPFCKTVRLWEITMKEFSQIVMESANYKKKI